MKRIYCDGCGFVIQDDAQPVDAMVGSRGYDLCEPCARILARILKDHDVRAIKLTRTVNRDSADSKKNEKAE